jgi:hypothetical protein
MIVILLRMYKFYLLWLVGFCVQSVNQIGVSIHHCVIDGCKLLTSNQNLNLKNLT